MKAVLAFLTSLLVLYAEGQTDNTSNKCKCLNYVGRISPKIIKGEPLIHEPSNFCPRTEIIITITTQNKEKCVDPQSPLGILILKNKDKKEKKGAVSTTTASSQNSTWSSSTQKIRTVTLH